MKNKTDSTLPMIGIFAACALFVLLFTIIQLAPLLQLGTENLTTYKGYWFPKGEPVNQPDVAENLPFTQYSGVLTTGNLLGNYWVKMQVKLTDTPTLLSFAPASVDQIDVWQRLPNGDWHVDRGGIQRGFQAREPATMLFSVPVLQPSQPTSQQTSELLINVRSNTSYLQARAYKASQFLDYDSGQRGGFGFYLGISVWVFTICLVVWMATGDRIWLDALLYDLAFTFFAACQSGILFKLLPMLSGNLASAVHVLSIVGVAATMCRFTIVSTALFNRANWLIRPYQLGYVICLIAILLLMAGLKGYALALVNAYLAFTCLWGFVLLFNLREGDFLVLTTYRILLLLYSVVPLMFIGSALLKINPSDTLIHIASPQNNIFTTVMIMMLLGFRAWNKTKQQIATEREKDLLSARLEMEEEKLSEASGFLSMIVHEVKNPLNFIRLAVSNLSGEKNLSPYAERTLAKIEKSVNSIDSVLERSIETEDKTIRSMKISQRHTRLDALLSGVIREFSVQDRQRIALETEQEIAANIDGDLISLALRNLLENALKYSMPETQIFIKTFVKNDILRIQVLNTEGNVGSPDETLIFQKYYRAKEALHISGTGLGLYWVRQAMRRMAGDVNFRREANNLICFELWTPV